VVLIVVLATPGPAHIAHAAIAGGAMLMVVLSFMAAEHRTRSLARANRRLAYTDPLTGIANTRRLRETLAFALARPKAEAPFALFAIDLDNFKLVNDTFDHTTGDAVLCAVAEALEAEVGADDLVARRGGDEFSVLIMHPAGVDLERTGERLSRAIERGRKATCPSITPSGSVAHVLSKPDDSISSVLQHADDNLHESKLAFHAEHGGREELREKLAAEEDNVSAIRPRVSSREAAMRSVSAAVSRAYSRPRAGQGQLRMAAIAARVTTWARGLDVVWAYVAATCFPIGFFYFMLSLTGALSPLPRWIGMISGLVLMSLGALSLHAAKHDANKRWLIWVFLAALAAVSATIANAGAAGSALIDTYVVLSLYGFYFMRPRQAIIMLLLCSGLFIGFAVGDSYPYGGIRSAVTVAVMLVSAAIVVKVRSVTLRFVRTNRELSEVDALTGVANLRALRLRVETVLEELPSELGENRPMLMTVDLDRFKQVNDRYNHTTGDQVLEAVARAVSECVRIDEMVARRGGDEFFVLFTSTNPEHLESVMPRVRKAISHARERICPDLTPTASVGFVSWEPGMNAEQFLASADGIMHDEKIETRARDYSQVA
ncbi:MAG: diguanylate cyclase domain-containing protein, partial [Solirubrobacterales bacterium]